jgi:hypothetical protein
VTANSRDITVVLNGQMTAKLRNGMFDEGPIVVAARRRWNQVPQD